MVNKSHSAVSLSSGTREMADALRKELERTRGVAPSLASFVGEAVKRYADIGIYNWALIDGKKRDYEKVTGVMTHPEFVRHLLDYYEKEC
jgi:hypothetical protein